MSRKPEGMLGRLVPCQVIHKALYSFSLHSNAPIFNPRSRVINHLPFCVLSCSFSSLFPIGDSAFASRRFGASPNKFLLRLVLQNFSAAVDVQTAVTTRVADQLGKSPKPS
uniref:Uncharacterized protein n=1 Tax=Solanum tuberosum TaxID=4113 RepID=M1DXS8_SOLTU